MKRERDRQRSKVYSAENWLCHQDPEFTTVDECKAFIKVVVNGAHWTKHKCHKRIKVGDGRGRSHACSMTGMKEIRLPKWSRSRAVIIHELAHQLADHTHGRYTAAHGKFFCAHYLALLREHISDEIADKMQASFDAAGVRY